MLKLRRYAVLTVSAVGMLALILDSRFAVEAAYDGLMLCLQSLIPALLPFLFLSILISSRCSSIPFPWHQKAEQLFHLPKNTANLLLVGFLGGYPVGAQAVATVCGKLSIQSKMRLICICNQAGPAFIFGVLGRLFEKPLVALLIWFIQIASALLVAVILPSYNEQICISSVEPASNVKALQSALKAMAQICGWVLMFYTATKILERWLPWSLPQVLSVLIKGFLELTTGCLALQSLTESSAFLCCVALTSFGGLCVYMQTAAVCVGVNTRMYLEGKLLQAMIALVIGLFLQPFLFSDIAFHILPAFLLLLLWGAISLLCLKIRKKTVAIPAHRMYNNKKQRKAE